MRNNSFFDGDRSTATELGRSGTFDPPVLPAPPPPPPRAQEFAVDATGLLTVYANFARVTGTPEELVLDFGLNTQMQPNPAEPVKLVHRLVLNYFTAKRLLGALHMAVQQHENAYGVLETDVQKRARQNG